MKTYLLAPLCLLALTIVGCAEGREEQILDRKVSQETSVSSRSDLLREFNLLIQDTPGLTGEERSNLVDLRESSVPQAEDLHERSLRLRALLVRDLMAQNYDEIEVAQIKTDLRNVEHERLSLFFQTVRDVNRIMGRKGSRNEQEDDELDREMLRRLLDFYPPF